MKVLLFDLDKKMCECWKRDFATKDNVHVINGEFSMIMKASRDIDLVVCAANAFGKMDGGLDLAIINYFGYEQQEEVEKKIWTEYLGEQPVGTSLIVDVPNYPGIKLCHTPTMRTPQPVLDPRVVYYAMRSSLVAAHKSRSRVVLIPAFAHLTGRVNAETVSTLMLRAYEDYVECVKSENRRSITWEQIIMNKNIDDVLFKRFE